MFTPRIGTEVAVQFIEGDIDRPLVIGALYNGQDLPPFSAGIDSGVNHPGVISGLHTHALDGAGFNQWAIDDATGQLRMRLLCSYTAAEVGLGHLIQQGAATAQRGPWRGSGFEVNTQGWGSLRAAKGLFLSTTARAGSYGSAQSTQMDASESLARLRAANTLGQSLTAAARHGQAHGLSTHDAQQALQKMAEAIDPAQRGKHEGAVGGQPALQQDPQRATTDPVHAFADPLAVLDSPAAITLATESHIAATSGQHLSVTAHGDTHHAARHTYTAVSGLTTSLYAHEGGIKAFAANGPVSLQAHTSSLQMLADQQITIVSVNDEVHIDAQQRIELFDGHSSIVLEGGDITLTMPGLYSAPTSTHEFMDAGRGTPDLSALPQGTVKEPPNDLELHFHYDDLTPVVGATYKVTYETGEVFEGSLDDAAYKLIPSVPKGRYRVDYGEDARPWKSPPLPPDTAEFRQGDVQTMGRTIIERALDREAPLRGDLAEGDDPDGKESPA